MQFLSYFRAKLCRRMITGSMGDPMWLAKKHMIIIACVTLATAAVAQNQTREIVPRYAVKTPAPAIEPMSYRQAAAKGKALPTWGALFQYNGVFYGFDMIGSDPSRGSATSNIQLVIVPVAFRFSDGTLLDPTRPVQCNGTESALKLTRQSPVLQSIDWIQGGTNVGHTQYPDAVQRAEWWNFANGSAPDYHVILQPVVMSKQVIAVPASQGKTVTGHGCGVYGDVEGLYFDQKIRELIVQLNLQPNVLPFFLTYDVVEDGGVLGYHSTLSSIIYATATFSDQNFGPHHAFQDMVGMSAVLSATFNDPFGRNLTPNWKSSFAPRVGCHDLLEVAEPLAGLAMPVTVPGNAHQYYVQDVAFELWYPRAPASTSVNGWFSMFGTFKDSSSNKDCQ